MHKLTFIFNDGSQTHESAIWENHNSALVHAKEQLRFFKRLFMVRINPLDGSKPTNVIREEKN